MFRKQSFVRFLKGIKICLNTMPQLSYIEAYGGSLTVKYLTLEQLLMFKFFNIMVNNFMPFPDPELAGRV